MVRLTRDMFLAGKPVAAVCHGPWMLVEADAIDGRTVTSWPSLKTDPINAGARWVDREVVEDGNLITSPQSGRSLRVLLGDPATARAWSRAPPDGGGGG